MTKFDPKVALVIWTIFLGAKNHPPGAYVVRAFDALDDATLRPHELFFECGSLLEARAKIPLGLVRMDREPDDDPTVVESWL